MLVVNVGRDKALPALVDRITRAGISVAARTRLESAILAANPGLDPKRLSPGDVLLVPASPELLKSAQRTPPTDWPDMFDRLAELIDEWRQAAEATDEVASQERTDIAKVVRDSSLRKAAAGNSDLAATIDELSTRNREEGTRAKAATKARAQRVEAMTAGLEAMRARMQ